MEKALAFFETQAQEGLPENATFRVYTPRNSPNALVFEETWESAEEHEQYWADLNAAPESAAMWDKWYEIVERSSGTELWNLREWR
jgi:quinol monooxygenase YgiN